MLALYLALGLNPLVEALSSRGVRRGFAVLLVALAALGVLGLAFWAVLPVAYEQINRLLLNAPSLLQELRSNPQIADLDSRYDIINRVSAFLTSSTIRSTGNGLKSTFCSPACDARTIEWCGSYPKPVMRMTGTSGRYFFAAAKTS